MRTTLLHLQGESWRHRYQVATHAVTAAAAGDRVIVCLWFDALRRWVLGGFDEALPGADAEVASRAGALSVLPPSVMLAEARALGAELWACETAVRLAGVDPAEAKAKVDDLPGLQQIFAAAASAEVVLFV